MKKLTFILIAFLITTYGFGQNANENSNSHKNSKSNFNLVPGSILKPKTNTDIDYSYKLSQIPTEEPNNIIFDDFLKDLSIQDMADMKKDEIKKYSYYIDAQKYYNDLSNKIKVTYTWDELWYIYIFDQKLKTTLHKIK